MLEFYKTFDNVTKRIDQPEPGCWINAVSPDEKEVDYLVHTIGVLPEFVKSSLDEEESSHIDYDDDENRARKTGKIPMMKIRCSIRRCHWASLS